MISFWKYLKFHSSCRNTLQFNSSLHLVPVIIVIIISSQHNEKVIGSPLNLAIESYYLALSNKLALLYSSWHRRSKSAAQAAHYKGSAGTTQSCATYTALSRIFKQNSADRTQISLGLQNTLHSSIQFLAIVFQVKHLPAPWKYNSSVQFLQGTLPYRYQIQTVLILHSLSPPAISVTLHLHSFSQILPC